MADKAGQRRFVPKSAQAKYSPFTSRAEPVMNPPFDPASEFDMSDTPVRCVASVLTGAVSRGEASPALDLRHAAIEEVRSVGGEEHCSLADLVRVGEAAERDMNKALSVDECPFWAEGTVSVKL